jgi:hypothetical protein
MRLLAALVAACATLAPGAGWAARYAVVIGNDVGVGDEPRLRYAERDARRIADILGSIGDFSPQNTVLLAGRPAGEVRRAIQETQARLVRSGEEGLLLVYYSGHADVEALHLDGERLPLADLRALVSQAEVATRVMVIDACRSGALTQTKGGHAGADFEMQVTREPNPHGLAIITSSAAGEDSQESDELEASFFTHHLASGLLGAADRDGDGVVTLAEAFAYAARHTVAATAATWAGPQHPTFRLDLGGREDLVLTRPGTESSSGGPGPRDLGKLALREPGWYFIRREGDDALVAEVSGEAVEHPLALAAGKYEVLKRAPDHLFIGTFAVAQASSTPVTEAAMRRIDFGRVVRKGGTLRSRALGVYVTGGIRGSLLGLGPAATAGLGARLDLPAFTATAALDGGRGSVDSTRGTHLDTSELQVRLGALKLFDARVATFALGAEAGASRLSQTASDQSFAGPSYALTLGPLAFVETQLARRCFIWLEGAAPTYAMRTETESRATAAYTLRITYRALLVVGAYL